LWISLFNISPLTLKGRGHRSRSILVFTCLRMIVLICTLYFECGVFEVRVQFFRVYLGCSSFLWKNLAVKRLLGNKWKNSHFQKSRPSRPWGNRKRLFKVKENVCGRNNLKTAAFKPSKNIRKRTEVTHVSQPVPGVNGVVDCEGSPQSQDLNHNDDLRKSDIERVHSNWGPQQVSVWLKANRYSTHVQTLASYNGADILRLSRENLTQLCGLSDGIRLYNALHSRSVIPHLTVYVCVESRDCIYQAVYLNHLSSIELMKKLSTIVGLCPSQVVGFYIQGPNGIKVLLTDELVSHLPDHSAYTIDVIQGGTDKYQFLLKMSNHSPT